MANTTNNNNEVLLRKALESRLGYSVPDDKFSQFYDFYKSRRKGLAGDMVDQIKTGAMQGLASLNMATGDYEGAADRIASATAAQQEDPDLAARTAQLSDPDSAFRTLLNMGEDPKAAAALVAQSLPSSLAIAAGALPIGRGVNYATKGAISARAAGAGAFGIGSAINEYGASVLQLMAESGVDIRNPEEIEAVITDPEIGPKLKERGVQRGIPVGLFDAISFGIAGKLLPEGKLTTAGALKETGAQAGLGAAGEAGAQIMSEGKITNVGDITLEGALEAITGIPQAILQPYAEGLLNGDIDPKDMANLLGNRGENKEPVNLDDYTEEDTPDPGILLLEDQRPDFTVDASGNVVPVKGAVEGQQSPSSSSKDTQLPKTVKKAEQLQEERDQGFPKEVVRGTPKQMNDRLMTLKRAELIERATKNAGISETELKDSNGRPLSKQAITNKILDKYGINRSQKNKVQTPRVRRDTITQKKGESTTTAPVLPQEMDAINKDTRKQLLEVATNKRKPKKGEAPTDPSVINAAENWLFNLSDNKALRKFILPSSKNKGLNQTHVLNRGSQLETLHNSLKVLQNTKSKRDQKQKAMANMVEALEKGNYFHPSEKKAFDPKVPELREYISKKYNLNNDELGKIALDKVMASPKTRKALLGEVFTDFVEGSQLNTNTPLLNSLGKKVKDIVDQYKLAPDEVKRNTTPIDDESVTSLTTEEEIQENIDDVEEISEYEALRSVQQLYENTTVPEAVFKPEKYGINPSDAKKSSILGPFKSISRSYDFMKSMGQIAREQPLFAPLFQMYRNKDAFREQLFRQNLNDFILLKEKHGIKHLEVAAEVLDIMTAPNNSEIQFISKKEDGRVRFKDAQGKYRVLDLKTSQALQDLQNVFKQQLLIEMQTFKQRAQEVFNIKGENINRSDLVNRVNELRALKEDGSAEKLESIIDVLDKQEKLFRSNRAYFPHTRSRGPYAIATYKKNSEGQLELAGLYSIKGDKYGNVDTIDEQSVRNRIQQDQETYGETFYTSKGESITGASSFLMNYDGFKRTIMRDARNPAMAFEALSHLLSNKNVDPNEVNKIFNEFSFDNDTERFFVNYRERGGFYGYDKDDRISSMLDALSGRSAMLTRYQYSTPMNKLASEIETALQGLGSTGAKSIRQFNEYYNYMKNPSDDAAKIRELTFWYFLAGNPSTSLLQLMSTYMNTLPWLAQYTSAGNFVKANMAAVSTSLYKASKIQANKGLMNRRSLPEFSRKVGVPISEAKVLLSLYERGILDPGYAIDAVNYSRNKEQQRKILKGERTLPLGVETLRNVGQSMIQVTEDVARMNSALLILDTLRDPSQFEKIGKLLYNSDPLFKSLIQSKYDGRITKEAIVEHGIDENHAIFGKTARPQALRSKTGAGLFAFLQYPISIIEQMARLLMDRGPAGKKAALNMILVYPILFGGMTAIPGYETWDWMTKWIQRLTGKSGPTNLDLVLTNALEEIGVTDPAMKDLIMKGPILSGLGEVDASQRVSVQFPFQPFMDVLMSPETNGFTTNSQALQFLGPLATIPTGAMNMINQVEGGKGVGESFVDTLAPIWARNIKKAEDIRTGNLRTTSGNRVIGSPEENPEVFGDSVSDEYIRQLIGVRPKAISQASRMHYLQNVEQKASQFGYTQMYGELGKELARIKNPRLSKEDRLESKQNYVKILKDLVEYNREQPNPKTPKELRSSIKRSLKGSIEQEVKPLKQRRHIDKDRSAKDDARRYGLDRLEGSVEDKK